MKNAFLNAIVFFKILNSLAGIAFFCLLIGASVFLAMNWKEFAYVSMTHCAGIIKQESELTKRFEELAEKEAAVQVCLNTDSKR